MHVVQPPLAGPTRRDRGHRHRPGHDGRADRRSCSSRSTGSGRERTAIEGTGIGLVISRRLAELMGGSLRRAQPARQGLVVHPHAAGAARSSRTPRADSTPCDCRAGRATTGALVHYIEDNETNVEVMRGILAQPAAGRSWRCRSPASTAWPRSGRGRPHLILLDMRLPDIDGLELLQLLREDPRLARVPVIVVSAETSPQRIDAALTGGAVGLPAQAARPAGPAACGRRAVGDPPHRVLTRGSERHVTQRPAARVWTRRRGTYTSRA